MYIRRRDFGWEAVAPAKLNLFLDVLGRRDDGFHELESLVVPVRPFDSLYFEPTRARSGSDPSPIELIVRNSALPAAAAASLSVPSDERNLVVQAIEALRKRTGCQRGARVQLIKRIPAGSGLGGGSSDAAAALRLANTAWGLERTLEELLQIGADIGSDVPFFLVRGAAICRGRGERVEPVAGIAPLHCVVIQPPSANSTRRVYAEYRSCEDRSEYHRDNARGATEFPHGRLQELLDALRGRSLDRIGKAMVNRLEPAAARLSPWFARLRDHCLRLGLVAHQLTGSGSAYFCVCQNAGHARQIAARLRSRRVGWVFATNSCQ